MPKEQAQFMDGDYEFTILDSSEALSLFKDTGVEGELAKVNNFVNEK